MLSVLTKVMLVSLGSISVVPRNETWVAVVARRMSSGTLALGVVYIATVLGLNGLSNAMAKPDGIAVKLVTTRPRVTKALVDPVRPLAAPAAVIVLLPAVISVALNVPTPLERVPLAACPPVGKTAPVSVLAK